MLALKGKEYLENLANPEADMNVRKICIDGLLSILKMKYDHLLPTDQLVKMCVFLSLLVVLQLT